MGEKVIEIFPCSEWNAPVIAKWLDAQAAKGLFYQEAYWCFVVFLRGEPKQLKHIVRSTVKCQRPAGYEKVGRIFNAFEIFASEKEQNALQSSYSKLTEILTFLFTITLFHSAGILVRCFFVGVPQLSYAQWLTRWDTLGILFLAIFFLLNGIGLLPGFLPFLRKPHPAWLNRLRVLLAMVSMVLVILFMGIEAIT